MTPRAGTSVLAIVLVALTAVSIMSGVAQAQAYSVSFTVVGLPTGARTPYYLDGVLNGTIRSGETKSLEFMFGGPHTLSVDLYVNVSNATRYQSRDNLWSFIQPGNHTFVYKAQYRLEVLSAYGSPSGAGWYDEGSSVQPRVATNVTAGPEGMRYVFAGWRGDASGQAINSSRIVMDRPKRAVALWKTQYTLRISSEPVGMFAPFTLWFDAASVAEFSAPGGTTETDTRYVFNEWFGDYTGAKPQGSLQMNGPRSVIARYKAQYLLTVAVTPQAATEASGMRNSTWYDADQVARLGPVPQIISVNSAQRLAFISWNVDGMTQQGTSVEISMDGPHHVDLAYKTQYYLSVTSLLGEPTGSGWYYSGERARFGVIYHASDFPVKYTLSGWESNPPTEITPVAATEATINVDRPYVVEAVWSPDYSPMWILLGAIGSTVTVMAAIVFVAVMRPGSFGRLASSLRSGFRRRKVGVPSYTPPAPMSLVPCQSCGARIPAAAEYCQYCRTIQIRRRKPAPDLDALDERVYDYIVGRHGEISLSRASADLGISVEELKNSTERLKRKKRLG